MAVSFKRGHIQGDNNRFTGFFKQKGKIGHLRFCDHAQPYSPVILRANEKNGRETAQRSFLKFTAQEIQKGTSPTQPCYVG